MDASVRRIPLLIVLLAGTSLGHAEPMAVPDGAAGLATLRIETAFQVAAEMPPVPLVEVPMAVKGDLALGCMGPFQPAVQAECIDTAYEVDSDPPLIVETRRGSTSILTRLFDFTVAARLSEQHPQ
jgi:hypothetical protein